MESQGRLAAVVDGGYCVGCGGCAAVGAARMEKDGFGRFQAVPVAIPAPPRADAVCPFTDGPDETAAAAALFPTAARDARLGHYLSVGVGAVRNDATRLDSSAGGLATWVLSKMLEDGLVDGVLHVKPCDPATNDGLLFRYAISRTPAEVREGARSHYYPVEMSHVLADLDRLEGRFAVVGVPCFIKMTRRLNHPKIAFHVGLVCGHLKSEFFAQSLAWQSGLSPHAIRSVNFRKKLPGRPAPRYAVEVAGTSVDGAPANVVRPRDSFHGSDWSTGFYRYKACDYCDDVFAELGDVAFGDAWLPAFERDSRGTSLVVARHPRIATLLREGLASGEIELTPLSPDDAAASQSSNLKNRRDGLAHRLALDERRGDWHPVKRVAPSSRRLSSRERRRFQLLVKMRDRSLSAFSAALRANDVGLTSRRLRSLVNAFGETYLSFRHDGIHRLLASPLALLRPVLLRMSRPTVVFLPPAGPGSLGDEAILLAAATTFIREGVRVEIADPGSGRWAEVLKTPGVTSFRAGGRFSPFLVALRAARARRTYLFGTDVLDGFYSGTNHLVRPADASRRAGCPLSVVSFSLNASPTPSALRSLRRLAEDDVQFVSRGASSRTRAESLLGLRVDLAPDVAFLLDPVDGDVSRDVNAWISARRAAGDRVIGVNFNAGLLPDVRQRTASQVETHFAQLLNGVLGAPGLSVLLLPHDRRSMPLGYSEFDLAERVCGQLPPAVAERTRVLPRSCGAGDLRAIVGGLDLVFTGRMHLMIAALCRHVPVVAVDYQDKFQETAELSGLPRSAIVSSSCLTDPPAFAASIEAGLHSAGTTRAAITDRMPDVRKWARGHFLPPENPLRVCFASGLGENPYGILLAEALREKGVQVEETAFPAPLWNLFTRPPEIFHVNSLPGRGVYGNLPRWRLVMTCALLRLRGTRIVWTPHDTFVHDGRAIDYLFENPVRWLLARLSHRTVFHNMKALADHERHFGNGKSAVVPHGHYLAWYPNSITRDDARRRLGLPDDACVILLFGWWRRNKGLMELIDAVSAASDRVWLVIAGQSTTDDLRKEVRRKTSGVSRVRIVERSIPDEQVQIYMNAADIVSLLYHGQAATSGVLLLAMSFGKAVICPDVPTFTDYVTADGAFFTAPDDRAGLAELVSTLPSRIDEMRRMGEANAARVRDFGWELAAERLIGLYRPGNR